MSLRRLINRLRCIGLPRDTADDWQAGDLAVCIDNTPWTDLVTHREVDGPGRGDLRRVAHIAIRFSRVFLKFNGDAKNWWLASCFRKVRPSQDEACSAEFNRQMKRLRPKVDA